MGYDAFPAPAGRSEELVEAVRIGARIGEWEDGASASALAGFYNSPFDLVWIKWHLKLGYELDLFFFGKFLSRCQLVLPWVSLSLWRCPQNGKAP
jgi:hypothetical protein